MSMLIDAPEIRNGHSTNTCFSVLPGSPGNEQAATEDLGAKKMEGIRWSGVRTTQTIPAGQMGNAKPFTIVNEVWTSPDLKTVIYSKRSDPLAGEIGQLIDHLTRKRITPFAVNHRLKIRRCPDFVDDREWFGVTHLTGRNRLCRAHSSHADAFHCLSAKVLRDGLFTARRAVMHENHVIC